MEYRSLTNCSICWFKLLLRNLLILELFLLWSPSFLILVNNLGKGKKKGCLENMEYSYNDFIISLLLILCVPLWVCCFYSLPYSPTPHHGSYFLLFSIPSNFYYVPITEFDFVLTEVFVFVFFCFFQYYFWALFWGTVKLLGNNLIF